MKCQFISKIDRFDFHGIICQDFDGVDSSPLSSMERHRVEIGRLSGERKVAEPLTET